MLVKIMKLKDNAIVPTRGTKYSAGYDISSAIDEPLKIKSKQTVMIPTGFCTEFEPGTVALIYSRSGLGAKKGLVVAQDVAVIDSDYRGEWFIPIYNRSSEEAIINPHDRVAQVLFQCYLDVEFTEDNNIAETERGSRGFGSTGS